MLWVACYLVPMFLYQIIDWLRKWWYGDKEEKKDEKKVDGVCPMKDGKTDEKAASGCPMANKKVEDIDAKAVDDVS